MTRTLSLACLLLATLTGAAHAQRIELHGHGDVENDALLRSVLRRSDLVLITTDTLLARNDTITGTLLIMDATARIDGVVAGDIVLIGVRGNLFLRPSARVLGRVHNVGGGLYPSELAVVNRGTRSDPNAPYRVERREADGTFLIRGTSRESSLVLDGIFGLTPPTYDRVDGVALHFGGRYLLPRIGRIEPALRGRVDYRSHRGAITGLAEAGVTRGKTELVGGFEHATLTNERWIRGDLNNSLGYLLQAKDYRDYYDAKRAYAEVRRTLEERAGRTTTAFIRAQVEDAATLAAGTPWTLFGDSSRENIVVNDGRISSVIAGAGLEWQHPLHVVKANGALEFAGSVMDGDHEFASFLVDADWAMSTFRDHTLEFELNFQGPLPGTTSLPAQRWTFVGGSGTLYTFDVAEFRGDRLAFVQTTYSIPLPARFRMRVLGLPSLDLIHIAGMAWTQTNPRRFRQNAGIRFRYKVAYVRLITNPEDISDAKFGVGVTLPRRARPWELPR